MLPRTATASDLLEAEEAPDQCSMTPRKKNKRRQPGAGERRCRPVVNLLLVAFVVAVLLAVVLLVDGGRAPAVWIAAAGAQLRRGNQSLVFAHSIIHACLQVSVE